MSALTVLEQEMGILLQILLPVCFKPVFFYPKRTQNLKKSMKGLSKESQTIVDLISGNGPCQKKKTSLRSNICRNPLLVERRVPIKESKSRLLIYIDTHTHTSA